MQVVQPHFQADIPVMEILLLAVVELLVALGFLVAVVAVGQSVLWEQVVQIIMESLVVQQIL